MCFVDGIAVYVGQSGNLRFRIPDHAIDLRFTTEDREQPVWVTPWGTFSKFSIKVSVGGKYGSWAMRELRLIRRLQPRFNRLHRGGATKLHG